MFLDRWSPRALSPEPISEHHLAALFEAARWAPSCYNEQPWLFLYATSMEDRQRFASALVEKNRAWASRAPLLVFLATRRHFASNGKPNRHAGFDAGAAWMALAIQAANWAFTPTQWQDSIRTALARSSGWTSRSTISWRQSP